MSWNWSRRRHRSRSWSSLRCWSARHCRPNHRHNSPAAYNRLAIMSLWQMSSRATSRTREMTGIVLNFFFIFTSWNAVECSGTQSAHSLRIGVIWRVWSARAVTKTFAVKIFIVSHGLSSNLIAKNLGMQILGNKIKYKNQKLLSVFETFYLGEIP